MPGSFSRNRKPPSRVACSAPSKAATQRRAAHHRAIGAVPLASPGIAAAGLPGRIPAHGSRRGTTLHHPNRARSAACESVPTRSSDDRLPTQLGPCPQSLVLRREAGPPRGGERTVTKRRLSWPNWQFARLEPTSHGLSRSQPSSRMAGATLAAGPVVRQPRPHVGLAGGVQGARS